MALKAKAKEKKANKIKFDTSYKQLLLSIFAPEMVEQVLKQLKRREETGKVAFAHSQFTLLKEEQIEQARQAPALDFLLELAMQAHASHVQVMREVDGEAGLIGEILKLRATLVLIKDKIARAKASGNNTESVEDAEAKVNKQLEKVSSLLNSAEKLSGIHLKQLSGKISNEISGFAQEWENFEIEQREALIQYMKDNNLPLGQSQEENLRKIEPVIDILNTYKERKIGLDSHGQ